MSGTIIRTVCLVLALVNQVLCASGKNIIPVDDETIAQLISAGFTVVTAIVSWWKNNSITREARAADEYMHALKNGDA